MASLKRCNWHNVAGPRMTMTEYAAITKGTGFVLFAHNIGLSINLTDAERRIVLGMECGRREGSTECLVLKSVRPSAKIPREEYVPDR